MAAANLSTFLKFENAKKQDICVISAKYMGGHKTAGEGRRSWNKTGGPGLKPPLLLLVTNMTDFCHISTNVNFVEKFAKLRDRHRVHAFFISREF